MRPLRQGQGTIEFAIVSAVILLLFVAAIQIGIVLHARTVLAGAVQDGARVASARHGTADEGVSRTQQLLVASLGAAGRDAAVSGYDNGDVVSIEARMEWALIIPWINNGRLPLRARTTIIKETFRGQR